MHPFLLSERTTFKIFTWKHLYVLININQFKTFMFTNICVFHLEMTDIKCLRTQYYKSIKLVFNKLTLKEMVKTNLSPFSYRA